jgi:hypothetical protein
MNDVYEQMAKEEEDGVASSILSKRVCTARITDQISADTLSPQALRIVKDVNAFVDESLQYAIISDCVDKLHFPAATDDIYATNSKWNPIDFRIIVHVSCAICYMTITYLVLIYYQH